MSQDGLKKTSSKVTLSSPTQHDVSSLAGQLAKLMAWARGMSLKQPLTEDQADIHMEEWAAIAEEVGFETLAAAVRDVMRNDTEWFPSVKAIRERAGLKEAQMVAVEAGEAWDFVQRHLREWGSDGMPQWCRGGVMREPPALPRRIDYAVRQLGGLWAINQVTNASLPFMRKDFIEAYKMAPVAEQMQPQLRASLQGKKLASDLKQLAPAKAIR